MNENKKSGISRLLEIAGAKKIWLIFSMLLAVLATIAQFSPYWASFQIINELSQHLSQNRPLNEETLNYWAYFALIGIATYGLLQFISLILSHIAAFNILFEMRTKLAKKLVKIPMGFFNLRSSGDLKKIVSEDVERIELFIAHHIPDLTSAVVFPILLLIYMFYVDWRLALVILALIIVSFSSQAVFGGETRTKLFKDYNDKLGKMNASVVEFVKGIQVLKIFTHNIDNMNKLKSDITDYRDLSVKVTEDYAPHYISLYIIFSMPLLFLLPAIIIILKYTTDYPSYLPTLLLFLILSAGLFFPMLKLMFMTGFLTQNSMGVDQIDTILNHQEIPDPQNSEHFENHDISFDNVTFTYDNGSMGIKNISFTAPQGKITALVGPSGSGKTTTAMLIARFWDPQTGHIRIGNTNIKNVKISDLMNEIAFVFQDTVLFYDTIEENIRMGNTDATKEDIINAAKAANCHDFIEELPQKYQTLVGEGGVYLSGGEQQRIAIARIFLKNAPILLLDEATAYADPDSEDKILEAFSRLAKNKTVIIIAHKLQSIKNADKIIVFKNSEIAQMGLHDELIQQDGVYKTLWECSQNTQQWAMKKQTA